jgi:uncharacterized protein involved in propanediol utilization
MLDSGAETLMSSAEDFAIAQCGELFQGVLRDRTGELHRCLMSLPCNALFSEAELELAHGQEELAVEPPTKKKALNAAKIAFELLGIVVPKGVLRIRSTIPEGKGYGSSTADCIAAVSTVARCAATAFSPEIVAQLVVRAEIASGNVMFERPVLFAHREGRVLEYYSQPLPAMAVVGFDTEESRIIETLKFPPAIYSSDEEGKCRVLVAALKKALETQDVKLLGKIATCSAMINERFLPKPHFSEVCSEVRELGALGVAVAHSGTAGSVLVDSTESGFEQKMDLIEKRLSLFGFRNVIRFETLYSRASAHDSKHRNARRLSRSASSGAS